MRLNSLNFQNKILYILDTTILILYRKLYINIVSTIVLNIEARQYNIEINLSISCSPTRKAKNNRATIVSVPPYISIGKTRKNHNK